jgi:hypothetical protein
MLCVCVASTGCSTPPRKNDSLEKWLGEDVADLKAAYGWPHELKHTSEGFGVYIYRSSKTRNYSQSYPKGSDRKFVWVRGGYPAMSSSQSSNEYTDLCATYFLIDKRDRVVAWDQDGNDCAASP